MSAVGLGANVKEREFRVHLIMPLRLLNQFVPHSNECRKLIVTIYVNTYAFRIKSRSKFNENMRNETHVRLLRWTTVTNDFEFNQTNWTIVNQQKHSQHFFASFGATTSVFWAARWRRPCLSGCAYEWCVKNRILLQRVHMLAQCSSEFRCEWTCSISCA